MKIPRSHQVDHLWEIIQRILGSLGQNIMPVRKGDALRHLVRPP